MRWRSPVRWLRSTLLAANLKALAEAEDSYHIRLEWYPGHEFVAEGSVSLVATLADGG